MTSKVIQGHKRRPFFIENAPFLLFCSSYLLIEETNAADHFERPRRHLPCTMTTFTLYKDDIGLIYYSVLCI